MEEKYSNAEHQKPVGKMNKEEIDVFLDKGYTLRLACLNLMVHRLPFHVGIIGKVRRYAKMVHHAIVPMDVSGSFQELNPNGLSI